MTYTHKKALVLGLGESGLAAARWLARCGAMLRVADTRSAPERLSELKECAPNSEFIGGQFTPALLEGIEFVVVSPGLSEQNELADLMPMIHQRAIPIWSEIELFAQALQRLRQEQNYHPKVVAITGTNGKTTVTSLVGLLVARAGKTVRVAGNISPAVLDVLRTSLDQQQLPDVWVLELSSFQLHTTYSLSADVATVLNVTPDHLDWHPSLEAYIADKARIFSEHTVQVLNRDDSAVMQMRTSVPTWFTFGQSTPQLPGEFGLQQEYGVNWLCMAQALEQDEDQSRQGSGRPGRQKKSQAPVDVEVTVTRLMPADALKIRGKHNAVNALAALALCRALQLPMASLLHGLREYQGEPHRVEFIASINQVDYYDDSKGTNVYATVAAINGLANPPASIVLIAGGIGKGQDFAPLREPIKQAVSTVVLIGQAAEDIALALDGCGAELIRCASLEQAVATAATKARPGDMVLLSPACSSLDMFKNYEHRGQVFVEAVKEIGCIHGEVA